MFQFPIRNSVRSDGPSGSPGPMISRVSIPHSEFCSFGLPGRAAGAGGHPCFNSPFGILFVRTCWRCWENDASSLVSIPHSEFCSFGLPAPPVSMPVITRVSIPHSEFCSFGPYGKKSVINNFGDVSIPHSEFCSFGRKRAVSGMFTLCSFNSPFGILFVRTSSYSIRLFSKPPTFQFPIRNSVRSDSPVEKFIAAASAPFQFPIRNSVRSDWGNRFLHR